MRALLLILALTLLGVVAAMAADYCPPTTTTTVQPGVCPPVATCPPATCPPTATAEQVALICLANSIGVPPDQVQQLMAQGMTPADVWVAYTLSGRAGIPVTDVVTSWQQTKSWSQTASKYNVTMADLGYPLATGSSDNFNTMFIAQYYGLPPSTVTQLRQQGYSWNDVFMIANAAGRTGQSVSQITTWRAQGKTWNDIAVATNVTLDNLVCPYQQRVIVTRATMGAGPPCQMVIYTTGGNALLTEDLANRYYLQGYDWMDVAIAANVSRTANVPIDWLLDRIKNGAMWPDILAKYNVPPEIAYNLTNYPFAQHSIYSDSVECARLQAIQKWQQPCEKTTMDYPVMAGRMWTTSSFYNQPNW